MCRLMDLSGKTFDRLTVIKRVQNNPNNKVMWLCKCSCGNETEVIGSRLHNGKTRSCGCLISETTIKRSTKHGLANTRLYGVRMAMLYRCNNSQCKDYKDYGGRGIRVCAAWSDKDQGASAFSAWAALTGYVEGLTIDRINVNGNYEPANCRWSSMAEQALNRRRRVDNISGIAGVSFDIARQKWIATLQVNKQQHYLGAFDDVNIAIEARKAAEDKYLMGGQRA